MANLSRKPPYKTTHHTVYDDVFSSQPRFTVPTLSPRIEDYAEIFKVLPSSRVGTSIPVLDLPAADVEPDVLFRGSRYDYLEVFGGSGGGEFAVFEDLVGKGCDSSDDAWTPDPSEIMSDESEPFACSNRYRSTSNAESQHSRDGTTEFKVSYNKVFRTSEDDVANGLSRVTLLDEVPGYSFMVNEARPPQKMVVTNNLKHGGFSGEIREAKQLKKSISCPSKPFVTVSDISLKTRPSDLPPPSRPPPSVGSKDGDSDTQSLKMKASRSFAFGEATSDDDSPLFYDVEVDASSSAAVSAATMKDVMEKAQEKLKSAKHMKERSKKEKIHGESSETEFGGATCFAENGRKHGKGLEKSSLKNDGNVEWKQDDEFYEVVETEDSGNHFDVRNDQNFVAHNLQNNEVRREKRETGANSHEEVVNRIMKSDGEVHEKIIVETVRGEDFDHIAKFWEQESEDVKRYENDFDIEENGMRLGRDAERERYDNRFKEATERAKTEKRMKGTLEREKKEKTERDARERHLEEIRKREAIEQEVKEKRLRLSLEEKEKKQREVLEKEEKEKREKEAREKEAFEKGEKEKRLRLALEEEEKQRRAREREEKEKKEKEIRERELEEKRLSEAIEKEEKEKRLRLALQEKEKRETEALERKEEEQREKEASEREFEEKRLREAIEKEEKEKRLRLALQEKEKREREALERKEEEQREKEAREREFEEKRLREAIEKEEKEKRLRLALQEKEKREREALERKEKEQREKEAREREFEEKRLHEAIENEENEKRLRLALEEKEKREREAREREEKEAKEARVREEKEKRDKEAREREAEEYKRKQILEEEQKKQKEAQEREEKEKREKEVRRREFEEKRLREALEQEENEKKLKIALEKEKNEKRLNLARERDEAETKLKEHKERDCELKKDTQHVEQVPQGEDNEKRSKEAFAFEREDIDKMWEESYGLDENAVSYESVNKMNKISSETKKIKELKVENSSSSSVGRDDLQYKKSEFTVSKSKGSLPMPDTVFEFEKIPSKQKANFAKLNVVDYEMGERDANKEKFHVAKDKKEENIMSSKEVRAKVPSQNAEKKGKNLGDVLSREEKEREERSSRERKVENERLRKIEEEKEREREREKDRMAVNMASLEKAAVERATMDARQKKLMEARERLEKVNAEARMRAERVAVERATAEARERAFQKAKAESATLETRERAERMRQSSFKADSSVGAGSTNGSMNAYSSVHGGVEVESAQRCKARLERHQRTAQRAAKALEEKNMRDLLAQRELAERNRLAEGLDAEVKRWSSGKEGNLRALLSTLQYILGPDSGWQPIHLTEVITSAAVKRAYRKATLCVHPDKLQQRGASIHQKYICEKVFDLLKAAWNKFNSEER